MAFVSGFFFFLNMPKKNLIKSNYKEKLGRGWVGERR
jgi:hypothetical protein